MKILVTGTAGFIGYFLAKKHPKLFEEEKLDAVCNLATQAGVRYS